MSRSVAAVRPATSVADVEQATRILAEAFLPDPVSRWIFPDDAARARLHPAFFRPFAELALADGELHLTDDGSGVALWLPFEGHPTPSGGPAGAGPADGGAPGDGESGDDELSAVLAAAIGPEHAKRFAVLDALMAADHPTRPHSYLPFIGVRPDRQGAGAGAALLEHQLAQLDATGTAAYLEASTLRSTNLYHRYGFRRTATTLDVPQGPTLYPMWRDPT
ncbi:MULTISPECIES: GNAT family N-acetyltransferase [Micromonospora]|uniref:Acetyltransferase (GNAT) family protein n=1 Tax=Micromonospora yangpuensis TaxID=683228 RepID=A0A1C6UGW8_9ACTN|nr:GNAT family N-acetyltransferase [Micromonospora yangpuensis]GGM04240.1 hypothetical protein GCM10012279_22500 [Micromonospora yangpuensis]SCL53345.1 Acetyltransferase (GNAT) family protein [Micromonospora yangpuensis]